MLHLLHSRFGDFPLAGWGLVRFLDEALQHDDALSNERAEEHTSDTLGAFQPQLEQPAAKRFCMRNAQVRADTTIRLVITIYRAASVSAGSE